MCLPVNSCPPYFNYFWLAVPHLYSKMWNVKQTYLSLTIVIICDYVIQCWFVYNKFLFITYIRTFNTSVTSRVSSIWHEDDKYNRVLLLPEVWHLTGSYRIPIQQWMMEAIRSSETSVNNDQTCRHTAITITTRNLTWYTELSVTLSVKQIHIRIQESLIRHSRNACLPSQTSSHFSCFKKYKNKALHLKKMTCRIWTSVPDASF